MTQRQERTPNEAHLEYVWAMPTASRKFACCLIIFLKEMMKGFPGLPARSALAAAQDGAKPLLPLESSFVVAAWLCEEGGADLISGARGCLMVAVTVRLTSLETSRARRLLPNWVRCFQKRTHQGEAGKMFVMPTW